jgi:hypothetical protein
MPSPWQHWGHDATETAKEETIMAHPYAQPSSVWRSPGQKTFGSFLRRARAQRGFSRHALSIVSGIDERRLEQIELGIAAPSYADIKKIAITMETPERKLLAVAGYVNAENP